MIPKNKSYFSLFLWVSALIVIGGIIGSLTKPEINIWYSTLNRSTLTPPNYVFPIAWTILYTVLGVCGWSIWRTSSFSHLRLIKNLYIFQMILNWSWTPLFFYYHLTTISLISLVIMNMLVVSMIYLSYPRMKSVSLLMIPYLVWILFASYLNFYIWQYNG